MASYQDGHQLLARTIRYIEDRRAEERRFTGAIEEHPSPLHIIWGKLDPVARYPMAERLARNPLRGAARDAGGHRALPDGRGPGCVQHRDARRADRAERCLAPEQERRVVVEEPGRMLGIGAEASPLAA